MAARTSDTLKEIEQIRARLDVRFAELERRIPPLAQQGRRAMRILGGGVGTGILLFTARRVAARGARRRTQRDVGSNAPAIVIRSGIGAPAALVAAAVWAGVRIYESKRRGDQINAGLPGASIVPMQGRRRA